MDELEEQVEDLTDQNDKMQSDIVQTKQSANEIEKKLAQYQEDLVCNPLRNIKYPM